MCRSFISPVMLGMVRVAFMPPGLEAFCTRSRFMRAMSCALKFLFW